jgi:8-oxo-dGTP pyrophosphatase MutT (NUDIX family)
MPSISAYCRQSAVIPYRIDSEDLQVLTITSRKRKRWIIPKGGIELQLSPANSAAKEAFEEAGVIGQVSCTPIGNYRYSKWGSLYTVEVYPLRVKFLLNNWLEDFRAREWVSLETAISRMQEPELKEILEFLPLHIRSKRKFLD